jgi:hypothetical protein
MASLSKFKQNVTKIKDGTWITLGDEWDSLEVLTRGFTDTYNDAHRQKLRRAAIKYSGDVSKIPGAESRKIIVQLLIDHTLLDIRNLKDQDGNDVKIDVFKELLLDPAYPDLYLAAFQAANILTSEREADTVEIKKS